MIRMHLTLGPMFLMTANLFVGQASSPGLVPALPAERPSGCNSQSLPSEVQSRLKRDFSSWRIQETATLSEFARKSWASRKPLACPRISIGLFRDNNESSYAVLLVPIDRPNAGCRFLVFSRITENAGYEMTVVEQSDNPGASGYFIRKVAVSRFFSEESKRKFQVQATEAILMVDSAEEEYEADIYYWSNGRFHQQWVDE